MFKPGRLSDATGSFRGVRHGTIFAALTPGATPSSNYAGGASVVNRSPFIAAALILCAAYAVLLGQESDPAPETEESEPELIDDRPAPLPGKAAPEDAAVLAILD